jgi:hypothetical protein
LTATSVDFLGRRRSNPDDGSRYRERLRPFLKYLAKQAGGEPTLADFSLPAFRLFVLEKQATAKYADHHYKKPSAEAFVRLHLQSL